MTDRVPVFVLLLLAALVGGSVLALLAATLRLLAARVGPAIRWFRRPISPSQAAACLVTGAGFTAAMGALVGTSFERAGVWVAAVPGGFVLSLLPHPALDRIPEPLLFFMGLAFSSFFWALIAFVSVRTFQRLFGRPRAA